MRTSHCSPRHRLLPLVGLCIAVALHVAPPPLHAAPCIVSNGQPFAEIVISATPARMTALAAQELTNYIAKITGASLSIVTTPSGTVPVRIYVGTNAYTAALGLTDEGLSNGAFRIVSGTDWLALIGRDRDFTPPEPHMNNNGDKDAATAEWDALTGHTWGFPHTQVYKQYNAELGIWEQDERGSFNAVCEFLRMHGVRWYLPDPLGEIVPTKSTIELPVFDKAVHPDFALRYPYQGYRRFIHAGTTRDEVLWQLRLGLNQAPDLIGLKGLPHGINDVHSRDEVKLAHPEYYRLQYDGTRDTNYNDAGQPCLSSEGLFTQNVAYVRAMYDIYNAPMVSVMPQDGYGTLCACPLCKGKDTPERGHNGLLSDYVWSYVNRVAEEAYKTHPNRTISCFGYTTYLQPADQIAMLSPNVVVGMAYWRSWFQDPEVHQKYLDVRSGWLDKMPAGHKQLMTYDYYLHAAPGSLYEFFPVFFPHIIAEDLHSLKGISMGDFIEVTRDLGESIFRLSVNHLNLYVTSRLWWDADQDVDALLDDYYTNFYGVAAQEMKSFVGYCEANWMNLRDKPDRIEKVFDLLAAAQARVVPGSVEDQRVALIADYIAPIAVLPSHSPTNFYWCGKGDGSNWTDIANWTNGATWWATSARFPSTTNDVVYLSDECDDAAQTIVLGADVTIRELRMDATGRRAYTIDDDGSDHRIIVQRPDDGSDDNMIQFTLKSRAEQPLTINCNMERGPAFNALGYNNENVHHALIVNGDRYYDAAVAQPRFVSDGHGSIVLGGRAAPGNWYYNSISHCGTGDLVLANPDALRAGFTQLPHSSIDDSGCVWSLAGTDVDASGRAEIKRLLRLIWKLRINEAGNADRTLTLAYIRDWPTDSGPSDSELRFVPNAGGSTGNLTVRLTSPYNNSMPVDFRTQDGARLFFDGSETAGTAVYTQERDDIPVFIRGEGSICVANNRTLSLQIATEYTGGTVITNNSSIVLNTNTVFAGVSGHGQLPNTGPVFIDTGCTFDLNTHDDTIGSLTGNGSVLLGGATLTVAQGVAPGTSVGMLTVNESGAVVLGGTNVFEFATPASFDKVLLADSANLTLGGVLKVEVPPSFTASDYGDYTIIDLSGGTAVGSFSRIKENLPTGAVQVAIDNNDVILSFGHGIDATAGFGGSIAPSGSVYVAEGGSESFTIAANPGNYIQDVLVDGSSVGVFGPGDAAYVHDFTDVTGDHTIEALFAALEQHTVTFVEGAHGTVTGTKVQIVNHGADCTPVMALPADGFTFTSWTGDSAGTDNPLTITGVTFNMTITANFRIAHGALFKFK